MNELALARRATTLLLSLLAAFAARAAGDLEEVLARQERAIGDLRTLRSVMLDARMEEPGQAFDLRIRMLRPGSIRVDLRRFGISVYSEGFGSQGPWQQHILQWTPRPTSAAGGDAIRNGVEGFAWGRSLREMRGRGHSVELLGTHEHAPEIGVRVVFRTGTQRDYFLDPASFRIVRSEQVYALHPDMKGTAKAARPIETSYLDYRRIEGFLMPTRIVNRDRRTGEVVQTVTVRNVRVNQPVEAAVFESR